MIAKPADGLTIIDPATARALPPEGITVAESDLHWARLAGDRDITLEPETSSPPPAAPAEPSEVTEK